jgi:hypothetical protein
MMLTKGKFSIHRPSASVGTLLFNGADLYDAYEK